MMFLDLVSELEKKHDILPNTVMIIDRFTRWKIYQIWIKSSSRNPMLSTMHMICQLCTIANCLEI